MLVTVWYCPLIIKRRVTPPPATWIIGSIAMNISAWSYYMTGRAWIDNVIVYSAALEILIVTTTLVVSLARQGELIVSFDRVQKACLVTMACILGYWYINRDAEVTFITTQTMMVLAYVPTVAKGLKVKRAFDAIGNWGLILLATVVGGVIPFITGNELGQFASVRAILTSGFTVGMLLYYDQKQGWVRWQDELQTLRSVYFSRPRR